jgi:RNA-directed DNA polymerase
MEQTIDATAHRIQRLPLPWKLIQWDEVIEHVRRLQIRIAKAWKEGKLRLVKTLQRLLLQERLTSWVLKRADRGA